MLLKLIPAQREPVIHFSLSFPDIPSDLPAPPSWTAQLAHLTHEDLEVPATLHSLDRSVGIVSLLEEVALDLEGREIRCLFVDGSVERFGFALHGPTNEQKLVEAIGSIINAVKESTLEDERVMKERELERQRERNSSAPADSTGPPIKVGRAGKHKKQRSLFMHIVSSIGSIVNVTTPSTSHQNRPAHCRLNSTASRVSTSTSTSTSTVSGPLVPVPGSSSRARALRRTARSALVDTFRRFVLGDLVKRFHSCNGPEVPRDKVVGEDYPFMYDHETHHLRERGAFCVWILHSMRRRALIRMEEILAEAGPPPPEQYSQEFDQGLCPTTMDVPTSFSDDESLVESPVTEGSSQNAERMSTSSDVESNAIEPEDGDSQHKNSAQDHPPRPSVFPRRAPSSTSVSTDDSSESSSTSRSSSSMSYASTAPSSVESEPEYKEENSPSSPTIEIPVVLHRPQYSSLPRRSQLKHLDPPSQHEYTQLAGMRIRLNHLSQFAASQSRVAADEVRNRLEVLAVRSRRRAWLNKALKGPLAASGAGGMSVFGLATPFRSSPLARYVITADDLARRASGIARSSCSSLSSLSSAYFRSVSSTSSASSLRSSPASSLSKSSVTPFPSSKPRLRPRIDYAGALSAAIVEPADTVAPQDEMDSMDDVDYAEEDHQTLQDIEVYQEIDGPSPARRHRRSMQEPGLPSKPLVASLSGGRLLPVNEERENENDEFTLALSAPGPGGRRRRVSHGGSTFMGCDEVLADDENGDEGGSNDELAGAAEEVKRAAEIGTPPVADNLAIGKRTHIRPRARTSSMVGALLRGAKGMQRSLTGGPKPSPPPPTSVLGSESLLCQPVGSTPSPPPRKAAAPPAPVVHATNRRAMDLGRAPVSTTFTNVDVEMDNVEMTVQLRIDDFDRTAGMSTEFAAELQQYHAREQEFTLAMDVPRSGGGGKRWRNSQYAGQHETSRRPKLSGVFGDSQTS